MNDEGEAYNRISSPKSAILLDAVKIRELLFIAYRVRSPALIYCPDSTDLDWQS